MVAGIGLSVGATNLTAVDVGRAAVTRSAVVTLYPDRPLEVGVPSENPRLGSDERGLVISDFVDRVGDPVGIVAADGSTHRGEELLADALGAMLYEVTNGRGPGGPVAVSYPAHWRPATVDALRDALAKMPEFRSAAMVSDSSAAVSALRDDPGLPASGLVALCDFGGSGTSISLIDAANGNQQRGATVRYAELSGDLIDQAVLTHVLSGLSDAAAVDVSGTSAIGPLGRLRAQCRAAKERLSTTTATSLTADLPGHRSEVRVTRSELDDAIRQPLAGFASALRETLDRNGVRPGELVAVASSGGGARVPLITTTLSETLGVPVVTNRQPELTAAIGSGLRAARGSDDGTSAMGEAAPPTAAAAAALDATQMAPEVHSQEAASAGSQALAWSQADDIPDVSPVADPYDYHGPPSVEAVEGPRPRMQFTETHTEQHQAPARRSVAPFVIGLAVLLAAAALAVWLVLRNNESTPSPSSTTVTTTPTVPPSESADETPGETQAPTEAPPPQETQTVTREPETVTQTQEAPPPPQTSEAPPPPPTSEAPPPSQEQPSSPSSPSRLVPTLPYETIPGLPFVPRPIQPQQP